MTENHTHSPPPYHTNEQVVAIVGAGFCGTMVAARLLRGITNPRSRIVLLNRPHAEKSSSGLARGLAYGTSSPDHLLNVPAGRMSAFDNKPDDFLNFLHANQIAAEGVSFVPRFWYGRYLQNILDGAAASSAAGFRVCHQVVSSIQPLGNSAHQQAYRLQFADGNSMTADVVVLALGNLPPANPVIAGNDEAGFFDSDRYIRDPWAEGALNAVDLRRPVLLMGTGLTMFDMVVSLRARAPSALRLFALSRRGLWPQPHRPSVAAPAFDQAPPAMLANTGARQMLQAVRAHIVVVEKSGGNWRDVVAGLRPLTPQLWQRLPLAEQRRFLRHLKPYWETHRHRAAPAIFKVVADAAASGELVSMAARIEAFVTHTQGVTVRVQTRGDHRIETLDVGAVINCTGPSSDISGDALLAQMAADGLIVADELRQGMLVAADYRLGAETSRTGGALYYVGPLLKARDWEATAVPELRVHAEALANILLKKLAQD